MEALQNLGIDGWGLVLYLVNFGVLLVVLQRYVFRPLLAFIDKRREEISTNVNAAETMRATLESERAKEVSTREAREAELETRVRSVKQVAREEAKKTLADAESQREAILSQARVAADQAIGGAMDEAQEQMLERIQTVVMHVLKEEVSEETVRESVKKSWSKLASN
ncbi:MAG: ATP synthase F0 subunit B [bacterium]|jgi:F-type H+-transporting ATPase subunit b|nr:ATP synthase F0 subunit B [bacterium]